MVDQIVWHAQAFRDFLVNQDAGGAQCASLNLVADKHMDVVMGPGLVTITGPSQIMISDKWA